MKRRSSAQGKVPNRGRGRPLAIGGVCAGIVALVASCGAGSKDAEAVSAKGANKPIELTYSITALSSDPQGLALAEFKKVVEDASKGNIKVKAYDSASLFKQEQEVAAVKSGQLDMTTTAAAWLTDGSPWVSMFTAGYIFQSYEHMTSIFNGGIGKEAFDRIAAEQGVRPLGAMYLGTRNISLVYDKPVRTPADLKGVNLRMPNSEAWMFLGRALGANPTPISFSELYMALQTKTVDGQDNPLTALKSAKFYEVTKSISLTKHVVDSVWPTINEKLWSSMTEEQRGWIMQGVDAMVKMCDDMTLDGEASLVDFFKSKGIAIYDADIPAFSKHVLDAYLSDPLSSSWDKAIFDKIQSQVR